MRSSYGAGKPRATHELPVQAIFVILAVIKAVEDVFMPWSASPGNLVANLSPIRKLLYILRADRKSEGLDTGC
jgi:hypothetical protein